MVQYPGKNQQLVLDELAGSELTMRELQNACIPKYMDLQRFDNAIGTLIRKGGIVLRSDNGVLRMSVAMEDHKTLTQVEDYILSSLLTDVETRERLIARTKRALHISEKGVQMNLSTLKKRGYIIFINSPKRSVELTQAGREALGEKNDIQS